MAFFENIFGTVCGMVVETTITRVIEKKLPSRNAVAWVGGIVSAIGFPEFGFPMVIAGHLLDRRYANSNASDGAQAAA